MDKQSNSKGIIIGTSVGALAGVIAGILLASQSGKRTRDDISKYLSEIKDRIAEELSKVGEVTKEAYDGIIDTVVTAYEHSKKITRDDAEEIRKKLDKNYNKIVRSIRSKKAIEVDKVA